MISWCTDPRGVTRRSLNAAASPLRCVDEEGGMLLRFRVANALSLRDEQELSFVVPQGEDAPAARTVKLSDGKTIDVYPLLGVFGANASGKSNVLNALKKMRDAVWNSYTGWGPHDPVPRERFLLDPAMADENTFYEADFVLE